jgi:hypothetical protein
MLLQIPNLHHNTHGEPVQEMVDGSTKWKCMVLHRWYPMSNEQPESAHQFLQKRPLVNGPSYMPMGSV